MTTVIDMLLRRFKICIDNQFPIHFPLEKNIQA